VSALYAVFGEGKELTILQMSCRSVVVFFICLVLIRLSGRRSFGIRTPLDNIIVILLGALLSRAITGASPFAAVVLASIVLVLLHRLLGWLIVQNPAIGNLVEGKRIGLYKNGSFVSKNMEKALVCKEDVMQGVRESALTEDMNKIEAVYMERNGEISAIKKEQNS
jgi:uncharacterized membrane protein YcaP (DUF421 family)